MSAEHQERFYSLNDRKVIEGRAFNLYLDEHHEIHSMLKKHKLTYSNSQVQPVAKDLVLEFYANAYRPPFKDTAIESELISLVKEKQIIIYWKTVNKQLKMKFREPNYHYLLQRTGATSRWPCMAMLDLLEHQGRDWQQSSTHILRNIAVVDLNGVPKEWTYFLHHTLDTNWNNSELITMKALLWYLLQTRQPVNIKQIISGDMHDMAQSTTKKSLGNASMILLLCKKAGVEDFIDGCMMRPAQELDVAWIAYLPKKVANAQSALETEERPV